MIRSAQPYQIFAPFYNAWHDESWYEEIFPFLMKETGLRPGDPVYEGGCGAGHLTRRLTEAGLPVFASDASGEMLRLAKRRLAGQPVILRQEDLRSMPIRRGFSAFIFCLDVIQYLGEKELQTLFAKVYRCLPEDGVLVFDHLPEKLLRQRAKSPPIYYESEGRRMWWRTAIRGKTVRYDLFFWHNEKKMSETQILRVYKKREIRRLLKQTGNWEVNGYGGYADTPMHASSERFCWFATKQSAGMQGKVNDPIICKR